MGSFAGFWDRKTRRLYPLSNPNDVRCPHCGSESVERQEDGVLGKDRMVCQRCDEDFLDPYREDQDNGKTATD